MMEENFECSHADFYLQSEANNKNDPVLTSKWSSSQGSDPSSDDTNKEAEELEEPKSPLGGDTINDSFLDAFSLPIVEFSAQDQNTDLSDVTYDPPPKKKRVEIRIIHATKRYQLPQSPVAAILEIETSTAGSQRRTHTSIFEQYTAQSGPIVPRQSGNIIPTCKPIFDSAAPVSTQPTAPPTSTLNRQASESPTVVLSEFLHLEPSSHVNDQNPEVEQKPIYKGKMTRQRKSRSLSRNEMQRSAHSPEYLNRRYKNNDAVKRCRQKKKRENEQKAARLAQLEIENKSLSENNVALSRNVNMLQAQNSDFYTEAEVYRHEIELYRQENEILKNDKQLLEECNENLQLENDSLKRRINEMGSGDLVHVSCSEAERDMLDICGDLFDVSTSGDGQLSPIEDFPVNF